MASSWATRAALILLPSLRRPAMRAAVAARGVDPPLHEREQGTIRSRPSRSAGTRTAAAARRRRSLEDLFLDEAMSRIGEDVARDTTAVLELLKSAVRLMR
jgi:hypothetical protein